jgi:16S rRNA (uracil1498-N3)-methyltransferase
MNIFYAPDIRGSECILDDKESAHCIRVLRMKTGNTVNLTDGNGNLYEAVITDPDPKKCSLKITGVINDFQKRNYGLHIAISPLKNYERFEWFVEKCVEIGVDEITPLICTNTEKKGIKRERIVSLIISAMKQSLKSSLTVLNEPSSFQNFVTGISDGTRMIAHCSENIPRQKIPDIYRGGGDVVILVGPEGDFSDDEINEAVANGFVPVHLGRSRLRSETAGIAACYSVYFLNQ